MYQLEAMIRIMEREGIMTKQDVLDKLKVIKLEDEEQVREN